MQDKSLLTKGCDNLKIQRKIYKDMRAVAKSVSEGFNLSLKNVIALKEYVHYHKYDWDTDPFVPDKEAKFKDRMVVPFRRVLEVIDNLRNSGNLDMLNDVTTALESRGIHLSVDDTINYAHKEEVRPFVDVMSDYQTNICNLADERKEFRKQSSELFDSTSTSYNEYVATLTSYRAATDKNNEKLAQKLRDKLQTLIMNTGIDKDVYLVLNNDLNTADTNEEASE